MRSKVNVYQDRLYFILSENKNENERPNFEFEEAFIDPIMLNLLFVSIKIFI